jgi:hypothetical protein
MPLGDGRGRSGRRSRRGVLTLAGAGLLTGCVSSRRTTPTQDKPPGTGTEPPPSDDQATLAASPTTVETTANGINAYSSWLLSAMDVLRDSLPTIADAADAAAEEYVGSEAPIAVDGDVSVAAEAFRRAGGLMNLESYWRVPDSLTGGPAILVLALREDQFAGDSIVDTTVLTAANHSGGPWTVIGLGRPELLDRAAADGVEFAGRVPTPAAPNEGLFATGDDTHLVPTSPPMTAAGLWTWTGEFVAACTRRDLMPPMYLAFSQEGGKEREDRFKGQRSHGEVPDPIDRELLGGRYIDELRANVEQVATAERDDLIAGADTLLDAHDAGGRDWGFYHGHAMVLGQSNYPHDPQDPRQINPGKWFSPSIGDFEIDDLGPKDAILCIGYNSRFAGWKKWDNKKGVPMDERLRSDGARLIWSFALREDKDDAEVLEANDEILIDQHWPEGDAVVEVPGYDIPILPTSGVISHQVHRTVQAGMLPGIATEVTAVPR